MKNISGKETVRAQDDIVELLVMWIDDTIFFSTSYLQVEVVHLSVATYPTINHPEPTSRSCIFGAIGVRDICYLAIIQNKNLTDKL